ncbi:MAG: PASTA domain-containing protein [Candidatus Hydrogenedentes bacterium]|nr:PASTA domain-containing protein [Candidatus Hydrogenedentota bacterium]
MYKIKFLWMTLALSVSVCKLTFSQVIGIDSIEELQLIGSNQSYPLNGSYVLTQDIDASATSNWNNGKGFQPIGSYAQPFRGTLDGQGYKITGLYINRPEENLVGIFRYVATYIQLPDFNVGKVRNLVIENATIVGGTNVGCVAGSAQRIGSTNQQGYDERHLIENIRIVNTKIIGVSYLGGVLGSINEGTLRNCFVRDIFISGGDTIGGLVGSSSAKIEKCCSTGLVYGEGINIGGLIGIANFVSYSTVNYCFSSCWAFGKDSVGGLIGSNSTYVTQCYSAGLIYGRTNIGGLVGSGDSSKVQISFFDADASQQTQSAGGNPLYTDQMLTPDIFQSVGWDYASIWGQDNGKTRPYLQIFPPTSEPLGLTVLVENGSVNVQPAPPYTLWSVVKLTPVPNSGYRFAGYELYTGTSKSFILPIEAPVVWTMSYPTSVLAKFLPNQTILIENIYDLQKIGNDLNYPLFWSYELDSDIDASETQTWNNGKGFTPIGTNVFWFRGALNGANYTLHNLRINRPDEERVALFRYLDASAQISNLKFTQANVVGGVNVAVLVGENSGSIRNVTVLNSQIGGNVNVGGVVGRNKGDIERSALVENSSVNCSTDYAGGICGINDVGSSIFFCNVNAQIYGKSYIGGITGANKAVIRKSYSKGLVSSSESMVGGLVGVNQGTIFQCYSHSTVNCNQYGGGLVGVNYGTVDETYSVGNVTKEKPNSGGLIGANFMDEFRSFWDTNTSGYTTSAGGTGKTTEEMKIRATFEAVGWNFELVWANDNDTVYPYLLETTIVPPILNISLEEAENLIIEASLTVGDVEYQCSNTVIYGNVITSDPLPGWEVPVGYPIDLVVSEGPCPPPVKVLTSIEELQLIGNSVDYPLDGVYELNQDIDAVNTANWNNGQGFSPIGSVLNPFTGYFDGKGFKIKNLVINRPYTDTIGLFGKISGNAIVKNLVLENVTISGKNNTGGVVGVCGGGTIYNITLTGTLSGKGNLGGIVGFNQIGIISDCFSDVRLTNSQYNSNTGGIVGQNQDTVIRCSAVINANITNTPNGAGGICGANGGFITYCTSLGLIIGSDNCGGLVGNNVWSVSKCWANIYLDGLNNIGGLIGKNTGGNVSNCFSTGTVKAAFYSGGLVGRLDSGTVENCYSIGKVSGIDGYIGGLIGYRFGGETTNSFWNIVTSRVDTSFGGTGKTASEMLNINTYLNAGWDFNNIWYMPTSKSLSYPQLRDIPPIEFISIPNLIGLEQQEAANLLMELGLIRGSVVVECNTAYPQGTVFTQIPNEGNLVASSYPVDIKVSSGPCPTNVPNLIGLTVEQAQNALANANLSLGTVDYRCSNQYQVGIIFVQNPAPGTRVLEGSSVDITVSQGPCLTIVPNVVGLNRSEAESQILSRELTIEVIFECNNQVEQGIVFYQEPEPNTQLVTGSKVTIYVSTGPCIEGVVEGVIEGEGISEGVAEGEGQQEGEGLVEGMVEGEGSTEEGISEGEGTIEGEGSPEGAEGEGSPEGMEGEGEVSTSHSADKNNDGKIDLSELLRVIQFFNMSGYHCAEGTEDGYAPGMGSNYNCRPHASDYNPQDWKINLEELLRLIQIFNIGHYYPCPGQSEDGFCF